MSVWFVSLSFCGESTRFLEKLVNKKIIVLLIRISDLEKREKRGCISDIYIFRRLCNGFGNNCPIYWTALRILATHNFLRHLWARTLVFLDAQPIITFSQTRTMTYFFVSLF